MHLRRVVSERWSIARLRASNPANARLRTVTGGLRSRIVNRNIHFSHYRHTHEKTRNRCPVSSHSDPVTRCGGALPGRTHRRRRPANGWITISRRCGRRSFRHRPPRTPSAKAVPNVRASTSAAAPLRRLGPAVSPASVVQGQRPAPRYSLRRPQSSAARSRGCRDRITGVCRITDPQPPTPPPIAKTHRHPRRHARPCR